MSLRPKYGRGPRYGPNHPVPTPYMYAHEINPGPRWPGDEVHGDGLLAGGWPTIFEKTVPHVEDGPSRALAGR